MDSNALPLLLSCSWLNCHTGQGDSNQQACRKNIASLAADSPTKKEALQHTTWELGRSTKAMGVESTGIEISCNPGLPEKTTQAVLDSFRDILVSVCIIIHNPPSCYMLHHCATDPHALNLTVQHQFLCAFLPMHSWKCPCNRQKNLQTASVWATRLGKCSRSLLLGSLWQVGLEKIAFVCMSALLPRSVCVTAFTQNIYYHIRYSIQSIHRYTICHIQNQTNLSSCPLCSSRLYHSAFISSFVPRLDPEHLPRSAPRCGQPGQPRWQEVSQRPGSVSRAETSSSPT